MSEPGGHEPVSLRAEVTGWLAFFLFVAGVYELRRRLDRSARDR